MPLSDIDNIIYQQELAALEEAEHYTEDPIERILLRIEIYVKESQG